MSTWKPWRFPCRTCGAEIEAMLLKAMHITRLPEVRAAIRDGTFQVVVCQGCGTATHVEKPTIYTDFDAGHYVAVELPPSASTSWQEVKARHQSVFDQVFVFGPPVAAELGVRTLHRIVFGLRALREKVLAWDAGLDDAMVEVAKLERMKREAWSFLDEELRLVAVLPPGGHLLFARYRRAEAEQTESGAERAWTRRPEVIGHTTVLAEDYEALLARRDELRATYPWVFDDWFVDATHRLVVDDPVTDRAPPP